MNIVIVGDGKVGSALSAQLGSEGHNITVIDNNPETLDEAVSTMDVQGVLGNGASLHIQAEAGVPAADLLIAATSMDELNMVCCMVAKHLGAKNTIARVRNPEYLDQLNILQSQLNLSMIINPELEAAREIARVVKFPPALTVETFAKGRVEIVGFKLRENHPIVGKKLMELPAKYGANVLICAVERAGGIFIPNGGFDLQAGDKIHITGQSQHINAFLNAIGQDLFKIRSVIVVGAGRICRYLLAMLDDRGMQIKIIEKDHERCEELSEQLPRAQIIEGDGTDLELLESEGFDSTDAFIALTGIDEENMVVSMLAHKKKIPKIITKINRPHYIGLADEMGIDTVVNPKMTSVNQITQYVRAMSRTGSDDHIQSLYKLFDGTVEALEFRATDDTRNRGVSLQKLPLKKDLLVAVIVRGNKVIIPHGSDCILLGDSVIVVAHKRAITELNDIFAG
jgi:trk system potassium uptake protein TrkA